MNWINIKDQLPTDGLFVWTINKFRLLQSLALIDGKWTLPSGKTVDWVPEQWITNDALITELTAQSINVVFAIEIPLIGITEFFRYDNWKRPIPNAGDIVLYEKGKSAKVSYVQWDLDHLEHCYIVCKPDILEAGLQDLTDDEWELILDGLDALIEGFEVTVDHEMITLCNNLKEKLEN